MRTTVLIPLLLLWSFNLKSQLQEPGSSFFDETGYVEVIQGNMPLIISVPHGGYEKTEAIPPRKGRVARSQDIYTIEIARIIRDEIHTRTGRYPHIIINHLHRTLLDANRPIDIAAQGNALAELVWNNFHDQINSARDQVLKNYGKGLYIDLHGHRHKLERIELGYNMTDVELRLEEELLDAGLIDEYISIRHLAEQSAPELPLSQLLRGPLSFGAMLEKSGQPTVPSPSIPFPAEGEAHFAGGHNTRAHGSMDGGTIDGIQIEIGLKTRTEIESREEVAKDISLALLEFISIHYFPNLEYLEEIGKDYLNSTKKG